MKIKKTFLYSKLQPIILSENSESPFDRIDGELAVLPSVV